MKTLNPAPKFMLWATWRAIRHPRTPITYLYCSGCKLRFNANEKECPKCHDKVEHSPERREEAPLPWWGSVVVIILGIICWVLGVAVPVPGLDEAGRALVYIPLGSLFGMSLHS